MKIVVEKNQVIQWLGDTLIIDGESYTHNKVTKATLAHFSHIPHPEGGLWGYRAQVYDALKDLGGSRSHYEVNNVLRKIKGDWRSWQMTYLSLKQLSQMGLVSMDTTSFRNEYTVNQGRLLVEKIKESEHQLDSLIDEAQPDGTHVFYVATENEQKTHVKFGFSYHPTQRLHELRLSNSSMRLMCVMPGSPHIEMLIKKRWWSETIDHREIFQLTSAMKKWMKSEVKAHDGHWFD